MPEDVNFKFNDFELCKPIEFTVSFIARPEIDRVIYNGRATIVFWKDKTKTVVKLCEGDTYDPENAIVWAYMKKIFGSTSKIRRTIKKFLPEE